MQSQLTRAVVLALALFLMAGKASAWTHGVTSCPHAANGYADGCLSAPGGAQYLAPTATDSFGGTSHAFVCPVLLDVTTSTIWGLQTAWSTTGATWTFYTRGTTTAASPGASDVLAVSCTGV